MSRSACAKIGRKSRGRAIVRVKAIIWQEDGVWCGSVPALPGCHTWGESYEQLLEMLEDAVQGWLEVAGQEEEIEADKQSIELSL
jgi:predicted RNase H-like HicB family nuclease